MPTIPTSRILTIADAVVSRINTQLDPLTNLGSAAVRGISLGFTDSELAKLKIVVRPLDYVSDQGNITEADIGYKIEIGIAKRVAKTTTATDPLVNLAIAVARLFQPAMTFTVASGDDIICDGAPFMPLFYHDPNSMDSPESMARFESRIHVEFKELGRSKAGTT